LLLAYWTAFEWRRDNWEHGWDVSLRRHGEAVHTDSGIILITDLYYVDLILELEACQRR
jgi:hypothetical protein